MTTTPTSLPRTGRHTPLAVTASSWAVPVLVLGQFALLAIVPVAIALVGALRHTRDRTIRWAAALLAVTYAIPLALWLTRPDGAPSLSKDIHPAFVGLIGAASAGLIVAIFRARRR
ncbi:hypothetical protein ACFY05_01640 [Microtetraspora fusca]|uniref:Integral membrane protein n=1 Tax=Microtetraspora fusca TaxID=1997 RepID=A0ABW6UWW3_MICFU